MIVNFSIDFFSSEECKSQFERETGENTVQSMSSEDIHVDAGDEELRVAIVYLTVQCNVV